MKLRITILLFIFLLFTSIQPVGMPLARAAAIPTFSIVSVSTDTSVTIRTSNFPANQTFTVRMGAIGTRAVGGTVVGTTASGSGGSFTATYTIPAGLKGAARIAIRMDSPQGYFAYNWFYNSTSGVVTPGPTATPGPSPTPGPVYTGVPTFSIQSVVANTSVTVRTNNLPPNQTFTVRMGAIGTRGIGGVVVGTTASGAGGALTASYNIPASLQGAYQIAIRIDSPAGYFAYNWFYNQTTGAVVTPGPTATPGPSPTPAPVYTGIPTFSIQAVVRNASVTVLTRNLPPNQTFTVRMGAMGTQGVGGTVVGTTDSGAGGAITATYSIPAGLQNAYQIAIRMESPQGYFAYNWFYNSTYP